jgi:hypothetical protein
MISWNTPKVKILNTWLSKHHMAITMDSTSRLKKERAYAMKIVSPDEHD